MLASASSHGGVYRLENELTSRDTLDAATTSETTNGRLCDALDVVTENLTMTLGTALAEALAALAA